MIVREWVDRDRGSIDALLSAVTARNAVEPESFAVHGPAQDAPGTASRTLVAVCLDDVVGIGTIYEYWLHPAHWRLALHVHPGFRRRGIGSLLVEQLAEIGRRRNCRPIQAATGANDYPGRRFLARHAFRLLMRTRLGVLDPRLLDRGAWKLIDDATNQSKAMGYRIASLSEMTPNVAFIDALANLHSEMYRLDHGWNPPASISTNLARQLFLDADELLSDALFIALHKTEPIAVASLRMRDSPDEVDLGWIGVSAEHYAHAAPLTTALVGCCVAFAERQHMVIRTEVDEANHHLWTMIEQLPVVPEPDWITLLRGSS